MAPPPPYHDEEWPTAHANGRQFPLQLSLALAPTMLTPNQIRCINEYYNHASRDLYFICERHDCDYEQMQQIIDALDPLLPGKGLDYNAILANDPIACDPLLIHCNQTIGRLGEVYERMMLLFDTSGQRDFTISKRTTINPRPEQDHTSFHEGKFHFERELNGKEKLETTTFPDKQRFKILETAMKCLDRSVKIQITLTQRREKLLNPRAPAPSNNGRVNKPAPNHEKPRTAAKGMNGMHGINGVSPLQGYSLNGLKGAFDPPRGAVAPPTAGMENPLPQATKSNEANNADADLTNLELDDAKPKEQELVSSASQFDPTTQFGPAKEFTPRFGIEEFREDPYAWRKQLKAKKQLRPSVTLNQIASPLVRRASEGENSLDPQLPPIAINPQSQPEEPASNHLPSGLQPTGKAPCAPPHHKRE